MKVGFLAVKQHPAKMQCHCSMQMSLHVDVHPHVYACECMHPAVSLIQSERGSTCWLSPISHGPSFLLHPSPLTPPADMRISWWSPHSAYSLSCVSLPVPHTFATSAFGLFAQESPPPAAYNNKRTLVTVSVCVALRVCMCA